MNKSLSPQDTKRYSLLIWKLLIGGIALFAIFISMIGLGLFGALPSFRDIEHPKVIRHQKLLPKMAAR